MAARFDREHSERTRNRIKIGLIVNRLELNALGELKNPKGEIIEMTQGQIRSAEILLRKTIPDLAAINVNIDGEAAIKFVAELPNKSTSPDQWLKDVGGSD